MLSSINSSFLNSKDESNWKESLNGSPRHRWYSYKEGFSSKIVERAIRETGIGPQEYLVDPFNGGGTSTLTAALLGVKSYGIEVNPFSKFVSEAKVQKYFDSQFEQSLRDIVEGILLGKRSLLSNFSTFTEQSRNKKWLFNSSVLEAFTGGFNVASRLDESNSMLYKLALISAALKNSNAVKDGKCLKYRDNWRALRFDQKSFLNSFLRNVDDISNDLIKSKIIESPFIIEGDSREVLKDSNLPDFKLCITSPPYLNSFDYTDIYRPELFIGEFVKNNEELRALRSRTLRSHVEMKLKKPTSDNFGSFYHEVMAKLNNIDQKLWDKQIPTMIQAYFEDMERVLTLLQGKLQKNGQIWIIVSNSAYSGIEIPVDLILASIGVASGLYLREIGVLRHVPKRRSKNSPNITYLRESVVIFTKTP